MAIQTTDLLVRVKALNNVAKLFTKNMQMQKAFDLLCRYLYSDTWIMISPGAFCYKIDATPKLELEELLIRFGETRLAVVFQAVSDDSLHKCYLIRLNEKMATKTCRRKKGIYQCRGLAKNARSLVGDFCVIDKEKIGEYWYDMCSFTSEDNGDKRKYYVNLRKFEWRRVL